MGSTRLSISFVILLYKEVNSSQTPIFNFICHFIYKGVLSYGQHPVLRNVDRLGEAEGAARAGLLRFYSSIVE